MTKRLLTSGSPAGRDAVKHARPPAEDPDTTAGRAAGAEPATTESPRTEGPTTEPSRTQGPTTARPTNEPPTTDEPGSGADLPLGAVPELSAPARRLLSAAVDSFAERGFHATTTRDIATRAGLSPAGLYVHYPSKSALLGHLSRVGHEAALAIVRRTLSLPGESPRRLHALVAAFVAWHAEHHTVARVVQYELRALEPDDRAAVSALRRELESLVEAEVRRGVAAGTLSTPHPRQATRAILSLAVDVARWYDPASNQTPARLGGIYADLALRMLGADDRGAGDEDEES